MRLMHGGILFLALALVPVAWAQEGLPDPQLPDPQAPPAPAPPEDPAQLPDEVQREIDRLAGEEPASGGPIVPDPQGGGHDKLGDQMVQTLQRHWLLTLVISGGLVASLFGAWSLASRYVEPGLALQSPERSMLYGFIKGNPGVHLKALSSQFGMKTSTVLWHVRKLECAVLVRSKKANGFRVFYPVSGGMEASQLSEAVTALSNENARAIFLHAVDHPAEGFAGLAEQLGVGSGTMRWHLKKLVKSGLLEEVTEGPRGALRPTMLGMKAYDQAHGEKPAAQPAYPPVTELDVAA